MKSEMMNRRSAFPRTFLHFSVSHSVPHSVLHSVSHFAVSLLFLLFTAAFAVAQPAVDLTVGRAVDAAGESVSGREGGQVTSGGLLAEYRLDGGRVRLFYDLDAGTFSTPGDWRYVVHESGAVVRVGTPAKRLFVGAGAVWRLNGDAWGGADFRDLYAMANVELRPASTLAWRFGYRGGVRRFPDLAELDQAEHDGFASLLANLPSRTTLIGEVHVGGKHYAGGLLDPGVAWSVAAGRGRGAARRAVAATPREVPASAARGPWAGQVTWLARVAQSLEARTGLSVQYTRRHTFGTLPPTVVETPALFFDDGVYDDRFASDRTAVDVTLKRVWARGDDVRVWTSWARKAYTATPALDLAGTPLAGEPLRRDRLFRAGADWTMPIAPNRTGAVALDLVLQYAYTRHQSNDLLYTYRSHVAGLGVAVGF